MKMIEKLYKATLDVKRAIELSLVRLRTSFVEADDKGVKASIFDQIVDKKREIAEAKEIADVAKAEKTALWAEAPEAE